MKKIFLIVIVLLIGVCDNMAQRTNVIEQDLQQEIKLSKGELIKINILVHSDIEQLSTQKGVRLSQTKRKQAIMSQKNRIAQSQLTLMGQLNVLSKKGLVSDISSLWIANVINCNATAEAIALLSQNPEVMSIGLDKEYQIVKSTISDVDLPYIYKGAAPHVLQVQAKDVWNLGYTGKNVVVAVLDSGTNPEHVDLKDNLWVGYADTDGDGQKDDKIHGWNFTAKESTGNANITDEYGHGTHCAGIVCGKGVAGSVTGVAPDATLMTVKVIGRTGGGSPANMIKGVEFAIENGASVLSISSGFKASQIGTAAKEALRRTFEKALEMGVVVCAAAGNDGNSIGVPDNVDIPAACPPPYFTPDSESEQGGKSSVICVGSVNSYDEYSSFSSQGPVTWQETEWQDYPYGGNYVGLIRPDICAPGDFIYSAKHDENDKYKIYSGTSQATPCVAGVIALLLEKNENLTPEDICRTLETTAKKLTAKKNNFTGSGRVDALAAVNAVESDGSKPYVHLHNLISQNVNTGKNIVFQFEMANYGKTATSENTNVTIISEDPYITILDDNANLGVLNSNKSKTISFNVDIDESTPLPHTAYVHLRTEDTKNVWMDEVAITICNEPRIIYQSGAPQVLDAGQRSDIKITLINAGNTPTLSESNVVIQSPSSHVNWIKNEAVLPILEVGETAEVDFSFELDNYISDGENITFEIFVTPNNFSDVQNKMYEFETGIDSYGSVDDGFDGWTTFDTSNDGRDHPWWHSTLSVKHRVESAGESYSGTGHLMSETYCMASLIEYTVPIDNYLVSPRIKATDQSLFEFKARIHPLYFGEHFGVAVSETNNSSPTDFTTIKEWSIQKEDGKGWMTFQVDLSAYADKDIYVAIRHFFTQEEWNKYSNGYDLYVLHVDDAKFTNIIDKSNNFIYNNYSYFDISVNAAPLPAPQHLVANAIGENSVQLSWDAVPGATAYHIYRDGVLHQQNISTTSYTDSNLNPDTKYIYSVAAVNNGKVYEQSEKVEVTTDKTDYSVKISRINPELLTIGENIVEITFVNNGKKEHESRSSVLISSDASCVNITSATANINALSAGQEVTRSFTINLTEPLPNDGKTQLNAHVAHLYSPYTSWDCPFVLYTEEQGELLDKESAINFIETTPMAVGYPTEYARTMCRNAIDEATTMVEVSAALQTFKETTDINFPESGKAYVFTNVHPNGIKYYINYEAEGLTLVARGAENANNLPASAKWYCRVLDNGRYVFVNNQGKYLAWRGFDAGTNSHKGYNESFDNTYSQLSFVKMTTNGINTGNVALSDLFGFVAFGGSRDGSKNSYFITTYYPSTGNIDFNQDGDWVLRYIQDNHSTAFVVEEVTNFEFANTQLTEVDTDDILLKGMSAGMTIGTFSAPYPTTYPLGVTAYYANEAERDGSLYLKAIENNIIPANEGVILVGDKGISQTAMLPVTTEDIVELENNVFSNSAKGDVMMGEYDYILANGTEGIGIYKAKTGSKLKAGKAYLSFTNATSARNLTMHFGGISSNIVSVSTSDRVDTPVFDLSGRRLNKVSKNGVYIINGKKLYIK